jgi:hypothetical protein
MKTTTVCVLPELKNPKYICLLAIKISLITREALSVCHFQTDKAAAHFG